MNGHKIRTRLGAGERVYGTLVVSNSPHWVGMVDRLGLDFVFIDTEHIALDRGTLAWMCQAYAGKGLAPIVRIASPDPYLASMVLDGGAAGIIAPYVESASQVRELVGAVKYKPLKGERLKRALEDPDSLEPDLRGYVEKAGGERVLIVNIESTPAIENLDDILGVPGLDAVLVGPHDLSCSLGIPERYEDPRFVEAVDGIVSKARARGVGAGIHTISASLISGEARWVRGGANLIVHSADIIAASEKLGEEIGNLRREFGDQEGTKQPAKIKI